MNSIDERLNELNSKIMTKRRLSSKIKELRLQRDELQFKIKELETVRISEEDDVNKLEGRSLYKFFFAVIGQKDKKLDKERREAYEATVKYEAALKALEEIEKDLSECVSQSVLLGGCEEEYEALINEKKNLIKDNCDENSQLLRGLETNKALIESQIKEINEAISAGQRALSASERIISNLESAENWGTYDLFAGGIISGAIKHSYLDDAQDMTEELEVCLRRFKTELSDIKIDVDAKVNIDGFTRFADFFYDGLIVDFLVLDHIKASKENVTSTRNQIAGILNKLKNMLEKFTKERNSLESRINTLVLK